MAEAITMFSVRLVRSLILFVFGLSTALFVSGLPLFPDAVMQASAASVTTKVKKGGVLVKTQWAPPRSLDYCRDANAFGVEATIPIYEGLVSFDYKPGEDFRRELDVIPYLAEKWEQPDENTYIFHLRRGVKWHDGKELSADDVVFSLNYIRDPKNACVKRGNLAGIKSVEKVDTTTVRLTTDSPMAPLLENLAQRETAIFPKHVYDAGQLFNGVKGTVGTGPMKLKSFDRNEKIVYEPFEEYWRGRPNLDGIVTYFVPEPQSRLAGFIAKQNDILTVSDKAQYDAAMMQSRTVIGEGFPTSHGYAIYMRVDKPPFNDIRVRRAVHLALNRQDMVRALAFNVGRINPPGVSAVSAWAIPQEELLKLPGYRLPKEQDIAESMKLLKEAGYSEGLMFSIQAVSVWDNPRIAEVVARQLKKVGITVKLEFIEAGQYFANQRKGNFQAQLNGMSSDYIDASLHQYYYSKSDGNAAGIADPELDRLIELQRKTLDKQKRYKVLRQIQDYLIEKMYVVPTIELAFYWIVQPYVHNLVNSRSTTVMLYRAADVWLDERAPKRSR
jgi:peptide/nickel transport system substrate-binding protein